MKKEIWKPIEGLKDGFYDGLYEVSNLGRFKMLPRILNCPNGQRLTKEKIVTGSNSHGYRTIVFKKNRIKYQIDIHVLVARAFISNPNGYPQVNHIDANRANNEVSNLEWCTQKMNSRHALELGLFKITRGSERSTAKLNEDKVVAIREMHKTGLFPIWMLAQMFSVGMTTVRTIINRTKWAHVA
jgi:hypothetical protein